MPSLSWTKNGYCTLWDYMGHTFLGNIRYWLLSQDTWVGGQPGYCISLFVHTGSGRVQWSSGPNSDLKVSRLWCIWRLGLNQMPSLALGSHASLINAAILASAEMKSFVPAEGPNHERQSVEGDAFSLLTRWSACVRPDTSLCEPLFHLLLLCQYPF